MRRTSLLISAALSAALGLGCNATIGGTGGAGGATSSSPSSATGAQATGSTGSSPTSTGASPATSTGASMTTSATGGGDPYAMARQICIDKINALRATKGLPAYGRWTSAETCVDQEATQDEMNGSPHGAWKSGAFSCNGSGQNECLGQGVAGIAACLDSMWAEGQQAACSGCDACADAYNPSCPNCDFYGMATGMVCGHYVNMSAKYFTEAACGFSSLGGWDAINFQ